MPASHKINLLPQDEFESSITGKLIRWAVNVGRWVVVFTELIVICAFLSRFYFDTQLANYFDDLKQKKAMVDSALIFEDKFRSIQDKIKIVKNILASEKKPSFIFTSINSLLPIDVFLSDIAISNDKLTLSGYSPTENGINVFLGNLINHPQLTSVSINNISEKKETGLGIGFSINATIKN